MCEIHLVSTWLLNMITCISEVKTKSDLAPFSFSTDNMAIYALLRLSVLRMTQIQMQMWQRNYRSVHCMPCQPTMHSAGKVTPQCTISTEFALIFMKVLNYCILTAP